MCSSRRHITLSPGAVAGAPLLSLLLFSSIQKCTKAPMYSCRHILDFSLFLPLSQSCSVSGQKCDIALCNLMCTLAGLCNKKKLLSLPGGAQGGGSKGARPCRGSQPQITALLMPPQPQKHHSLQFILKPLAPFSSFAIH